MDGGSGKRDRQKYEIYMEATALARIESANDRASIQLAGMHAEVESEREKHDLLMKDQKVNPEAILGSCNLAECIAMPCFTTVLATQLRI